VKFGKSEIIRSAGVGHRVPPSSPWGRAPPKIFMPSALKYGFTVS